MSAENEPKAPTNKKPRLGTNQFQGAETARFPRGRYSEGRMTSQCADRLRQKQVK